MSPARSRSGSGRTARRLPGAAPTTAYIALGSNLEDPERQIRGALEEIALLPDTCLLRASSLYRTVPVGYRNQPDFLNAVAAIETRLAPRELLERLLRIERRHGRVRGEPNAPRTLDLDIVLFGDRVCEEPGLVIPHPRLHERAFVLVPLVEIAPHAVVPGKGRATDLLQGVDAAGVSQAAGAGA